jgi:hypothetical protein
MTSGASRYPFWTYWDLLLFLGSVVPALAAAASVLYLVRSLTGADLGQSAQALLLQFATYCFWFGALYALFRFRHAKAFWDSLAWNWSPALVARYLSIGPLLAVAVILVASLLRTPQTEMPIEALLSDTFSIVLVGTFATTLGPLCEELAFRGFLMPLLCRTFGAAGGIVLAALPFAVLHGPQYAWSWRHVTLIGLTGIAFGWVRLKTGSTAAATAMHASYNGIFFLGILMSKGGILSQ